MILTIIIHFSFSLAEKKFTVNEYDQINIQKLFSYSDYIIVYDMNCNMRPILNLQIIVSRHMNI